MRWETDFTLTLLLANLDNFKQFDNILPLTCKASLLEALRKTLGKSFVPGSILNLCLISLPSHVKLEEKKV